MARLKAAYYRQGGWNDESEWLASIDRYYERLGDFEVQILGPAFEDAPFAHPEKFPSMPQLVMLAQAKQKAVESTRPQLTEGGFRDDGAVEKIRAISASIGDTLAMPGGDNG